MNPKTCTRRDFFAAASSAAGAALLPLSARSAPAPQNSPAKSPSIGCFAGTVFGTFRLSDDAMLDAVRAAGYQSVELYSPATGPRTAGSPPPSPTPESLASFREKLTARGLTTNVGNLSVGRRGASLAESIAAARQSVTNAHTLGQKFVLTLGTEDENEYIQMCKVLSDAAAFGQDLGVQVVIKPHDSLNWSACELLGWVKQVNHPNFRLFWDPGNVIYYTGRNPVKQLELVVPYVTGLVGKDCYVSVRQERMAGDPSFGRKQGGLNEVRMQFGLGKVDFVAIFRTLKAAGFHGPIYVEGVLVADTLDATIANAKANREYLIKVMNQERWRPYFFGSTANPSTETAA